MISLSGNGLYFAFGLYLGDEVSMAVAFAIMVAVRCWIIREYVGDSAEC